MRNRCGPARAFALYHNSADANEMCQAARGIELGGGGYVDRFIEPLNAAAIFSGPAPWMPDMF